MLTVATQAMAALTAEFKDREVARRAQHVTAVSRALSLPLSEHPHLAILAQIGFQPGLISEVDPSDVVAAAPALEFERPPESVPHGTIDFSDDDVEGLPL